MISPFLRSPYNYDIKAASDEAAIPTVGESLTVQSQSEDADINVLMKRFGVTGKFPENPYIPQYRDFSEITDFRDALHAIQHASDAFMTYPADFRARFDNDPNKLLHWVANRDNIPEMRKLGMLKENSNVGVLDGGGGAAASPQGSGAGGAGAAEAGSAARGADSSVKSG